MLAGFQGLLGQLEPRFRRCGEDDCLDGWLSQKSVPIREALQTVGCAGLIQAFLARMPKRQWLEVGVARKGRQVNGFAKAQASDSDTNGV